MAPQRLLAKEVIAERMLFLLENASQELDSCANIDDRVDPMVDEYQAQWRMPGPSRASKPQHKNFDPAKEGGDGPVETGPFQWMPAHLHLKHPVPR